MGVKEGKFVPIEESDIQLIELIAESFLTDSRPIDLSGLSIKT